MAHWNATVVFFSKIAGLRSSRHNATFSSYFRFHHSKVERTAVVQKSYRLYEKLAKSAYWQAKTMGQGVYIISHIHASKLFSNGPVIPSRKLHLYSEAALSQQKLISRWIPTDGGKCVSKVTMNKQRNSGTKRNTKILFNVTQGKITLFGPMRIAYHSILLSVLKYLHIVYVLIDSDVPATACLLWLRFLVVYRYCLHYKIGYV